MKQILGVLAVVAAVSACRAGSLCVAVEKAELKAKPDGFSMTLCEVPYGSKVEVLDEVEVAPQWRGIVRQAHSTDNLPHWVRVRVGDDEGYVPEGAVAEESAVSSAIDDLKPVAETTKNIKRGFSEVEDDVALSTMKGAAGKQSLGSGADLGRLREAAVAGAPDVADLRPFLFDGELDGVVYPATAVRESNARMPKLAKGSGLDPELVAKFKKLKEIAKDSSDPDIKLALEAMQSMVNKSFETLDPAREHALGEYVAARFVMKYGAVDPEDERSSYVRKIGQTVARAANGPSCFQPCRFILVDAPAVTNACAIAGGYVFVMSGLLDFVQDEDELAGVLAHEIAHLELRHGLRAVGSTAVFQLFSAAKNLVLAEERKADAEFAKALDMVYDLMVNAVENGHGAKIESEADWRALQLAVRAGYDSGAFVDVLRRFRHAGGGAAGSGYPRNRAEDAVGFMEGFGFDGVRASGRMARRVRFNRIMRR